MTNRLGDVPLNNYYVSRKEGLVEAAWLLAIFLAALAAAFTSKSELLFFFAGVFLASAIARSILAGTRYTRGINMLGEDLENLGLTDVQFIGDGFTAKHQGDSVQIRLRHGRQGHLDVLLDQLD